MSDRTLLDQVNELRRDVDQLQGTVAYLMREITANREHWRRVAESIAPVDLFRESGGSLPAVAPCWCGDPRGIFHAGEAHPPVLNKTGGCTCSVSLAGSKGPHAAWCAAYVNKSGGCGAVFRVGGGGPVYTCNLPRGHQGRSRDSHFTTIDTP